MLAHDHTDSDGEGLVDKPALRQRRATYRVQLRPEFDFAAAAAQAPYFRRLGVSHVYCSPYMQAAAGSTHGYDVVDPTAISVELGGDAGHRAMCDAFTAQGLSQVLDIVPNHMSVADRRNRWWWDVLADGRRSPYASFFDIDWEVDEPRLHHRVLLPVLDDQVGRALENGLIRLVREDGSVLVAYLDHRYPLSVETVVALTVAAAQARAEPVLADVATLPGGVDATDRRARHAARRRVGERIAVLLADPAVGSAVDTILGEVNADVAALDRILNEQHHRLARWRTAVEEVNYRRFFDNNTLAGLRMEVPEVFEEATALVAGLVRDGDVDGLRIDHIDGLRLPLLYARWLRDATGPHAWLVAEKIVQHDEQLPPWVLDGTSGYDFLAAVNGLFVDPSGREELALLHEAVTEQPPDFTIAALEGKHEVLRTTLVSDVERLTGVLGRICDAYPAHRDHTHTELRDVVVELVAAVAVYRTYVDPARRPASAADAAVIRAAAAAALSHAPHMDERLVGFVTDLLILGETADISTTADDVNVAQHDLVLRLQQLCATTMATGVEDTACYRHLLLVSINEVGDSPATFGRDAASFHAFNARTQAERPLTMLTTSTHDTKRSEDVRCRIDLLSEIPGEWSVRVHRWRAMNQAHRRGDRPGGAMEYLLYQTLAGAWPLEADRARAYMQKAAHEAKRQTSWLQPDEAYDSALSDFVGAVLDDARFVADLEEFVATLVDWGRVNSLSTTLLKLASPGVPDIYQGCELWDLSLVDPDNRRPVDFHTRARLLEAHATHSAAQTWVTDRDSGAPKLLLVRDALALRARCPHAFDQRGDYGPLHGRGRLGDDVVAFTRGAPVTVIAIAQRRPLRRRGRWEDTEVQLPQGEWRDVCRDGVVPGGTAAVEAVLSDFPVALFERVG